MFVWASVNVGVCEPITMEPACKVHGCKVFMDALDKMLTLQAGSSVQRIPPCTSRTNVARRTDGRRNGKSAKNHCNYALRARPQNTREKQII